MASADSRQAGSLWSSEEDVLLLRHVSKYGTKHWGYLQSSGELPHRDQKACCNRFILLKRKFLAARARDLRLPVPRPFAIQVTLPSGKPASASCSTTPTSRSAGVSFKRPCRAVLTKGAIAPAQYHAVLTKEHTHGVGTVEPTTESARTRITLGRAVKSKAEDVETGNEAELCFVTEKFCTDGSTLLMGQLSRQTVCQQSTGFGSLTSASPQDFATNGLSAVPAGATDALTSPTCAMGDHAVLSCVPALMDVPCPEPGGAQMSASKAIKPPSETVLPTEFIPPGEQGAATGCPFGEAQPKHALPEPLSPTPQFDRFSGQAAAVDLLLRAEACTNDTSWPWPSFSGAVTSNRPLPVSLPPDALLDQIASAPVQMMFGNRTLQARSAFAGDTYGTADPQLAAESI